MKKFAALLPVVLLGLSTMAGAYDDDLGSLSDRSWSGGRGGRVQLDPNAPLYYRPTQRYYGPGYTISYRYVPVYRFDSSVSASGATNFRSEAFHIATDDIPAWGTNSPRLTVKDPKSAAPRTAVTSIVRKKSTTHTPGSAAPAGNPAIIPGAEAPAPVPTPTPSPAPTVAPKP